MSVPIIMSIGEDAFRAVPDTYREAAIDRSAPAAGRSVTRCSLPAAKNGLLAAVLARRRPRNWRDDGGAVGDWPFGRRSRIRSSIRCAR